MGTAAEGTVDPPVGVGAPKFWKLYGSFIQFGTDVCAEVAAEGT